MALYSFFNSRFPCSKMPRISRNLLTIRFFYQEMWKNRRAFLGPRNALKEIHWILWKNFRCENLRIFSVQGPRNVQKSKNAIKKIILSFHFIVSEGYSILKYCNWILGNSGCQKLSYFSLLKYNFGVMLLA